MRALHTILSDKRGNSTPLTLALVLGLLLLLCTISEFFRLTMIANGVKSAMQSSVISVATTNYDEIYNGLREGYSGGYWLSDEEWAENLDHGDIYGQLDALLGTEPGGNYHSKANNGGYEYRLSELSVDVKNVSLKPGTSKQNLEVAATIRLEVPLSFGWRNLPPLSMHLKAQSTYMPKF